nr:fimbrial protein [Serratia proteamaculans]ULG13469.1 SefE [Serratia proteamaculans]ULG18923.1 SefE [Serratia proteamaculans]
MMFNNSLRWGVVGVLSASLLYSGVIVAKQVQYVPNDNWAVDGLHGALYISGKLVESPCIISAESEEQEIKLGGMPLWQLAKPGDVSEPTLVHFYLEDCGVGDGFLRSPEHGDNAAYIHQQMAVMVRLVAEEEPENHRLIRLSGSAKGVALLLEDSARHVLQPGERSWPQVLTPGHNDLVFQAQLIRTRQQLEPGNFRAVVYLGLEYR